MGFIIRAAVMAARKAVQVAVVRLRAALKGIATHAKKAEGHAKSFQKSAGRLKVAMPKVGVRISGLKELRRELRKLENAATWTGALRDVNRAAAAEALAEVQRLARSQPRVIGKRRRPEREHWSDYVNSFRVVASQTSAGIRLGSTVRRKGWHAATNFGAGNRYRQFPPSAIPDYALYRGIERALPKVLDKYGDMLDDLTKKAFPD
jgi:hypothetical protein